MLSFKCITFLYHCIEGTLQLPKKIIVDNDNDFAIFSLQQLMMICFLPAQQRWARIAESGRKLDHGVR